MIFDDSVKNRKIIAKIRFFLSLMCDIAISDVAFRTKFSMFMKVISNPWVFCLLLQCVFTFTWYGENCSLHKNKIDELRGWVYQGVNTRFVKTDVFETCILLQKLV